MGYSTFRHFLKEQFPNLRFQKDETTTANRTDPESGPTKHRPTKGQHNANKPTFMC